MAASRQQGRRPAQCVMPITEALRAVRKVRSNAQDLLPVLAGNPRNLRKATDVVEVFAEYELRLCALGVAPNGAGLSNKERDLVHEITKRSENALGLLSDIVAKLNENMSTTLDRVYANGGSVDGFLRELVESLKAAPGSFLATASSSAGFAPQTPIWAEGTEASTEEFDLWPEDGDRHDEELPQPHVRDDEGARSPISLLIAACARFLSTIFLSQRSPVAECSVCGRECLHCCRWPRLLTSPVTPAADVSWRSTDRAQSSVLARTRRRASESMLGSRVGRRSGRPPLPPPLPPLSLPPSFGEKRRGPR